jgi:hypothetical protein
MTQTTPVDARTEKAAHGGFLQDHHLERYERWLDNKFKVPGIDYHIGLDGIIGLIPGIGDALTSGVSALFVLDGWKSGIHKRALARMVGNIGIDAVIGTIPLVGDLFDFAFKSNVKNLRILREERERRAARETALP